MSDTPTEFERTWLRFDDVTCVRCGRYCGPTGAPVYVYKGEGMVCDECHDAEGVSS
jgi:hypothetical protein